MAGLDIKISVDAASIRLQLDRLQGNAIPRATARALNRAATSVRDAAAKEIRKVFPLLKARSVKGRLRIKPARANFLEALIAARGDYDPPLYLFDPKWRQRQAGGATIRSGRGGRLTVAGAFTARTRYGRLAVFRREGASRRPLQFLRASDAGLPTLAGVLLQSAVQTSLASIGRARFAQVFEQEARFRLAKVIN